ncbi:hypothetical protein C8F01DRAFT_1087753 [Mycena amicta]|nr:hypothetical protein C8F01DRAFT_1087753 [Mycena amicta]
MPFILPADGQPATSSDWEWDWEWQPKWQWLSSLSLSLSQLQLPLVILAALFVLLAVRAFLLARITPAAKDQPILEKGQRQTEKTTWLVFSLFKTPSSVAPADMLEIPPQPQFVHVHRPRAQKPSRLAVDAPLPTVYVSEVPASMAKLIMSRHVRVFSVSVVPHLPPRLPALVADHLSFPTPLANPAKVLVRLAVVAVLGGCTQRCVG